MSNETTKLPTVIQSFIKATNDHDSDAFINTFADDALVNDVARNFWGKDSIKQWADKEIIDVKVTVGADKIVEHYGDFIITALIDGNYDKSKVPDPLYLDYFFTVNENQIVKLIIIKNKERSAK
jgi:ketosteroid isomerase-like protein